MKCIFTGRNEVVAKVIFLPLSVIHSVHKGGGGLPQCMLGYHPPPSKQPPPPEANSGIRSTSGRYASYWNAFLSLIFIARMHSSRMRTACFSGCLGVGCLPWDVCIGGMSSRDTHPPARCMLEYTSVLPIACWDTPHPREQNDRCKNITFPQLRLRAVTSSKALDEHNKEIVRNTPNENNFGFERL